MMMRTKIFLISFILSLAFWWGINSLVENLEDFLFWQEISKQPGIFTAKASQQIPRNEVERLRFERLQTELKNLKIEAKAAISVLINGNGEERILFGKNTDQRLSIASLTKLMTALIVLENYDLSREITISKEAINQPGDFGKLEAGKNFPVRYLLYPLLIESSNDAAFSLANDYEEMTEEKFVELMNLEAQKMNLENTFFVNSTGIDPKEPETEINNETFNVSCEGNYSTAADLVKFTKELFKKPLIWEILSTPEFNLYGPKLINTNELLEESLGWSNRIIGGKTGETPQANGCFLLVLKTPQSDYLINIVLGSNDRFGEMRKLLNWLEKKEEVNPVRDSESREEAQKKGISNGAKTFDPALLEWEEITSNAPWSPRDSHGTVVFQNKIWLMGGLNGNGFQDKNGNVPYWRVPHYSDVWSSKDGRNWQLVTKNAPWGKKRSMQAIVFKNKIWLIGGWGPEIGYSNDIWVTENGIDWEKIEPKGELPAVEGDQLVVFEDKLWLIGGVRYDERKEKNYVWVSEDGINWTEATERAPWSPRWDHTVTVFKNKLWLIGGMNLEGEIYQDVWSSQDGKNWLLVTDNPPWRGRQGHGSVVFQNKIWIIGRLNGKSTGGDNDVWYSEDGYTWGKTQKNAPWLGREDIGVLVFKDKIWALGGMDGNSEWKNDIWFSIFSP